MLYLLNHKAPTYGTDVWEKARNKAIFTGSTTADMLGHGYKKNSRQEWLDVATGKKEKKEPPAFLTSWGVEHEPTALKLFREETGFETFDVGCMSWLDASPHLYNENGLDMPLNATNLYRSMVGTPDAIGLDPTTQELSIVEVKCPRTRKFDPMNPVPSYYYDQVQFYLHQFDMKRCYFAQLFLSKKRELEKFHIQIIPRDESWWQRHKPTFIETYDLVQKIDFNLPDERWV